MSKKTITVLLFVLILGIIFFLLQKKHTNKAPEVSKTIAPQNQYASNPLSVEYERNKKYPGSNIKIEQTLENGSNYKKYIASYMSDGLKIYGLLSIPVATPPTGGYPAIIFNHGYIPPEQYRTTERYTAYFDAFARDGYVVFKPDYRGNGSSQGQPTGAYFSPGYTTDVMNALRSVEKLSDVNKQKVGMWGHSMGGFLTLRALVLTHEIKAAVIWGGVVGSYKDMSDVWWSKRKVLSFTPSARELQSNRPTRESFIKEYGAPNNTPFWNAISSTTYLKDITTPLQLHQGLSDEEVPPILSQKLYKEMKKIGKNVELYTYERADHNISQSFNLAMEHSVNFFNSYLKQK